MEVSYLCIDNFYSNVKEVRKFALQQEYGVRGNYPGKRTDSFLTEDTENVLRNLIRPHGGEIVNWCQYNASFQIVHSKEQTWIHSDPYNMWAGVLYLTPNAPINTGTGLYRHKRSKQLIDTPEFSQKYPEYSCFPEDFELFDMIGNRYNRLILYRSNRFHCSLGYFGDRIENGRLFQVFFFDTEY